MPRRILILCILSFATTAHPCAMFTVTGGQGQVYFANNEDFTKPGVIWFVPAKDGRLGRINLGFDDGFAQGSMNERGLCFDAAALPKVPWEPDPKKKTPPGSDKNLLELIMDRCGTVDEALGMFDEYNCWHLASGQFMFADATGASAVVTWDPRGRLSVVRRTGNYLLNTNDRLEWSGLRDERYVLAERMLQADTADADACAQVLAAIRQCGKDAFTSYSNIFDPRSLTIHLYNLGNFGEKVTLNLRRELDNGHRKVPLAELFAHSPRLDEVRAQPRQHYATEITINPEALARYAGRYRGNDPAITVTVAPDNEGGLTFLPEGQTKPAILFPESATYFRFRDTFGTVTFHLDAEGGATGLTLHRPGDSRLERLS